MLTVHKIGGTSMSKFEDVLQNIVIAQAPGGYYYDRIFVVSAYNNVTNWLLEHKNTCICRKELYRSVNCLI